jgi:hypothetical protein
MKTLLKKYGEFIVKQFPLFGTLVIVLFLFGSSMAFAAQVTVDPNGFPGFVKLCKRVNGVFECTFNFGLQTIDAPNDSDILMNAGGENYTFLVDTLGNVSNPNPNSFDVSGSEIVFKTVEIQIDPLDHEGSWTLQNIGSFTSAQTFPLLLDADMSIGFASQDRLIFHVSAAGSIVPDPETPSFTIFENTLTFNTVSVDVDPGAFQGDYFVHGISGASGPSSYHLIPGLGFNLFVGTPREGHRFEVSSPCGVTPSRLEYANSVVFDISCSGPNEIAVAFDIKPRGCKNRIRYRSRGKVKIAILGSDDFDVSTIDIDSVRIANREGFKFKIKDVANPIECKGKDGFPDLVFKIQKQTLLDGIEELVGEVNHNDVITTPLTGNLLEEFGGTPIVGSDDVLIKKTGKLKHNH